jgi:hypothetical protein
MAAKLTVTRNYDLFFFSGNRPVVLESGKRRLLRKSMQRYGYIQGFPVLCRRENGRLIVLDGQHRLTIAKELGLPVSYTVDCERDTPIEVHQINNTQKCWEPRDYVEVHAAAGKQDYKDILEFADRHGMPVAISAAILGDHGGGNNIRRSIADGSFKVRSRGSADRVANLFRELTKISRVVKSHLLIGALFAICQVEGMDDQRIIRGANRSPESLVKYGSKEAYLTMLEDLYNLGHSKNRVPLKFMAESAMRNRNPAKRKELQPA